MSDSFSMFAGRVPVLGHLPRIHMDVLGLLRRAQADLGPVFHLDHGFGVRPLYLLGQEAFALLKNEVVDSSANLDLAGLLIRDTLIPADGDSHRRMRGVMNGPFSPRGLKAAAVGSVIDEVVSSRIANWSVRDGITVSHETKEITLDIIFRLIGIEHEALPMWRKQYHEYVLSLLNFPFDFPGTPAWRSKRAIEWMDGRFRVLVERCRREGDRESLLGALANGRDENGQSLSEKELLANVRFLGLAGHETTASVMTWMLLHFANDPALWDRVCEEANAGAPPLEPGDLARFPLAEAVFRETLRLYPPTWFLYRRATSSFEFRNRTIQKGSTLLIPIITLSRDPDLYPDPDRFDPDRWMNRDRTPRPIETCQFSGGPHFCLGYRLALQEVIQFAVFVARSLTSQGRRPVLKGRLPKPRYLPLTHAPYGAKIHFQAI